MSPAGVPCELVGGPNDGKRVYLASLAPEFWEAVPSKPVEEGGVVRTANRWRVYRRRGIGYSPAPGMEGEERVALYDFVCEEEGS